MQLILDPVTDVEVYLHVNNLHFGGGGTCTQHVWSILDVVKEQTGSVGGNKVTRFVALGSRASPSSYSCKVTRAPW